MTCGDVALTGFLMWVFGVGIFVGYIIRVGLAKR